MSRLQHSTAAELLEAVVESIAQRVAEKLLELQPRPPPPQDARYLNERAVAQRTGISVKTLQNWRCCGRGPPYQHAGKRVIYPVAALQEWLAGAGQARADRRTRRRAPDSPARSPSSPGGV